MGTSQLVDQSAKFWNHFFDFVMEWDPLLRAVYEMKK